MELQKISYDFQTAVSELTIEPGPDNPLPRIAYSIDLGQHVEFMYSREDDIVQHMQNEGITNDAISAASIIFTSDPLECEISQSIGALTHGIFRQEEDEIFISVPNIITNARKACLGQDVYSEHFIASHEMSRTLHHEIRHMHQSYFRPEMDKPYLKRLKAKSLAAMGLPYSAVMGSYLGYEAMSGRSDYSNIPATIAAAGIALVAGIANERRHVKASQNKAYDVYLKKPSEKDARQAESAVSYPLPVNALLRQGQAERRQS